VRWNPSAEAARGSISSRYRHLGWLLLMAAVVVAFAPLLFLGRHAVPFHRAWGAQSGIAEGGDPAACVQPPRGRDSSDLLIHYPNEALVAEALRRGELPTWNPYVGCGTPGMGGGQVYPFSPFFWPFYAFPNPWTFTVGLMLACLFGGAGVFCWLGRFGLPDWARGFGGAAWVLSPWVTQFFTLSDVWAGAWFGWLLWAWDRFLRDPRLWWLPAPMVAGMTYCGHPGVALLLAVASGAYCAASWAARDREERPGLRSIVLGAAGAVALAGAMTSIHWLPVAMRSAEALPYKFVAPESTLRGPVPIWDLFVPTAATYLAPATLGLALLGILWKRRPRALWLPALLLAMAGAGLLQPPVFGFLNRVVTFGGLVPGFYYRSLLCFGLVPLLAMGAAALLVPGSVKRGWGAALLLVPAILYLLYFCLHLGRVPGAAWVSLQCVVLALLLLTLYVPEGTVRGAAVVAALALTCLDPFVLLPGWVSDGSPYALKADAGARYTTFSSCDPGRQDPSSWAAGRALLASSHGRMWAGAESPRSAIPFLAPNLSTLWEVRDVRIQDVLLGFRMALLHQELQKGERPWYFSSLNFAQTPVQDLALLGVTAIATPVDRNSGRFTWAPVARALPRAYVVHGASGADTLDGSLQLLRDWLRDEDRFGRGAILEGWSGPGNVGSLGDESVRWIEDGLSRVSLEASAPSGGVLVLLDAFAEGWDATLDGGPVPIYPANLAFRAVAVPPGIHRIRFAYHAPGVARGLLIAGLGWAAVLYFTAMALWRRGPSRRRTGGGGA
jgi:hypothetical protein